MDPGFVGLIVSCFNSSKPPAHVNRIQVIAFQSVRGAEQCFAVDATAELDSPTRAALEASAAGAPGERGARRAPHLHLSLPGRGVGRSSHAFGARAEGQPRERRPAQIEPSSAALEPLSLASAEARAHASDRWSYAGVPLLPVSTAAFEAGGLEDLVRLQQSLFEEESQPFFEVLVRGCRAGCKGWG